MANSCSYLLRKDRVKQSGEFISPSFGKQNQARTNGKKTPNKTKTKTTHPKQKPKYFHIFCQAKNLFHALKMG